MSAVFITKCHPPRQSDTGRQAAKQPESQARLGMMQASRQATRQPSSQATKVAEEPGSQAAGQPGSRATGQARCGYSGRGRRRRRRCPVFTEGRGPGSVAEAHASGSSTPVTLFH